MGKQIPPAGRSKVRIFFVDADLAPGDMQELTGALSSAIRPTHMIQRLPAAHPSPDAPYNEDAGLVIAEAESSNTVDGVETERVPNGQRSPKPRKYRSPKPVTNLVGDAGGKAFEDFAREMGSPTEHAMRYLVAAAWLAEYANIPEISVDHVWMCYKFAGWTFDPSDPGFAFRYLKKEGYGDTKAGKFAIGYLGTAKVQKMKSGEV